MPFQMLQKILKTCHEWQTHQVTFLGGEPTLYPDLARAISEATALGLQTRLVTNGSGAFLRFARENLSLLRETLICFSIDGADAHEHDMLRQLGSFSSLRASITFAQAHELHISGIISLTSSSVRSAPAIIKRCEDFGLSYINVHYVTARGACHSSLVPEIDDWLSAYRAMTSQSQNSRVEVRVEETFRRTDQCTGGCAVRDRNNLMFFPDGRVFMCLLFLDVPKSNAFFWTDQGLIVNPSATSEIEFAKVTSKIHCPAFHLVSPTRAEQAKEQGYFVPCIYEKRIINSGKTV